MWFTADLPSAGPRGKLPRAGVKSPPESSGEPFKDWTFPGQVFGVPRTGAACVENPINRGVRKSACGSAGGRGGTDTSQQFQGDLPGSVSGAGEAAGGGGTDA